MTDERIQEIVLRYGYDAQSRQCIEEMAELTQAINKFWRKDLKCGKAEFDFENACYRCSGENYDNLCEEIADTQIMLEQMKEMLNCKRAVEQIKEEKLERQIERIRKKADGKRGNNKRGSDRTAGKVQSGRGSGRYKYIRHKAT